MFDCDGLAVEAVVVCRWDPSGKHLLFRGRVGGLVEKEDRLVLSLEGVSGNV